MISTDINLYKLVRIPNGVSVTNILSYKKNLMIVIFFLFQVVFSVGKLTGKYNIDCYINCNDNSIKPAFIMVFAF